MTTFGAIILNAFKLEPLTVATPVGSAIAFDLLHANADSMSVTQTKEFETWGNRRKTHLARAANSTAHCYWVDRGRLGSGRFFHFATLDVLLWRAADGVLREA